MVHHPKQNKKKEQKQQQQQQQQQKPQQQPQPQPQRQRQQQQSFGDYLDLGMFRLVWKTFFLVSLGFWFLRINPNWSRLYNPNQIWFILPPRHSCQVSIIEKYCMLNMRSIPWGCAIFLFRFEACGNVKLCFWWRKPFLQINGVPVPVERSWSSLKGVLHIYKEMVWLKGLLHIFKSWCNFQKRQLIQVSFWLVKHFLQTNRVPSKQVAAGFLWKECYIFLKEMVLFSNIEASWASLRGMLHL